MLVAAQYGGRLLEARRGAGARGATALPAARGPRAVGTQIAHHTAARRSPRHGRGDFVLVEGGGHAPHARDPVAVQPPPPRFRGAAAVTVAATRARADARPLPRRGGLRRARRRPRLLRGLRRRADDVPALPDLADLALAALEGADPIPLAPLPRRHVRPARERPLRPARRTQRRTRSGSSSPTAARCSRRPGRETALVGGLCDGGGWALMLAATDPAAVLGVAAIAPFVPAAHAVRTRTTARYPVRRAARHRRGLGQVERPLLARATTRASSSSSSRSAPGAALDEAARGRVGWGLETDAETLILADRWRRRLDERGGARAPLRASAARCS